MKKVMLIFIALLMMAFCACGTSTSNKGDTSSKTRESQAADKNDTTIIEPSQLISKEEAEDILNLTVEDIQYSEEEKVGLKLSFYDAEDEFLQISLIQQAFMTEGQTNTPEYMYRETVEAFEDAIKVEGIGDEAYFATPGLHILQDDYYILIGQGNLNDDRVKEKLIEAGKLAVENLKIIIR